MEEEEKKKKSSVPFCWIDPSSLENDVALAVLEQRTLLETGISASDATVAPTTTLEQDSCHMIKSFDVIEIISRHCCQDRSLPPPRPYHAFGWLLQAVVTSPHPASHVDHSSATEEEEDFWTVYLHPILWDALRSSSSSLIQMMISTHRTKTTKAPNQHNH